MTTLSEIETIPAGATVVIQTGEHSDKMVIGVFRARVEVDLRALLPLWVAEHPTRVSQVVHRTRTDGERVTVFTRTDFEVYKFVNWLVNVRSVLEEIVYHEVHLHDDSVEDTRCERQEPSFIREIEG